MSEKNLEIITGTIVLIVAAAFLVFTIRVGGFSVDSENYNLNTSFRSAEGIDTGTEVRMAGVKIGMVKSLAIELGPRGIRANALLPGIVEGERQNRVIEAKAKVKNISFDNMKDEILSGASLNRFVTHDDLAEQAHFLCSPLGKNISGQAVSVCGNIEKSG